MAPRSQPIRLVHITTVPMSLWAFFRGQIAYMVSRGFDVQALASPGEYLFKFATRERVPVQGVKMPRRITPGRDLVAVFHIVQHLHRIRPHIVHAHTPKGGLLGMIAAYLARVPVRMYHIHGLPHMTAQGWRGHILRWTEKLSCRLAHRVLCVSHSIREVAIEEGLCPPGKITVPGGGSINGVDAAERYNPDRIAPVTRQRMRAALSIPEHAVVAGFVGRIARDKGVADLCAAWGTLREEYPELHLLVIGPSEPQDPIPPAADTVLRSDPRIHVVGQIDDVVPFFYSMDVVVLPTYREGFPLVPLEAAAMGLPVVATRIPGCIDAVKDGETGLLVAPGDPVALVGAIRTYLTHPELRRQHGQVGRERVQREFRPDVIWHSLYEHYIELLQARGLPAPQPDQSPNAGPAAGTQSRRV